MATRYATLDDLLTLDPTALASRPRSPEALAYASAKGRTLGELDALVKLYLPEAQPPLSPAEWAWAEGVAARWLTSRG